jgi:O-antigen/teichoic acid export membrane protein
MGLMVQDVRPARLRPGILAPSELAVFYGGKYSKILLRYIFPVFISIFIFQLFSNPETALDLGRNPIDSE